MSDAIAQVGARRALWAVALGGTVAIVAMGIITWHALRLEEREHHARAMAAFQSSLRLALWRIDSAMTPIIAREAARPYFEYQSFYPADRALDATYRDIAPGEVLVPSPLLMNADDLVTLHYQVSENGEVSSPQAPTGRLQEIAESVYVTPYAVQSKSAELQRLQRSLLSQTRDHAHSTDDANTSPRTSASEASVAPNQGDTSATRVAPSPQQERASTAQPAQGAEEFEARRVIADKVNELYNRQATEQVEKQRAGKSATPSSPSRSPAPPPETPSTRADAIASGVVEAAERETARARGVTRADASQPATTAPDATNLVEGRIRAADVIEHGPFRPRWLSRTNAEPELVFERVVHVGASTLRQGFLLDWPRVRAALLEPVRPIFPDATIRPIVDSEQRTDSPRAGRLLATIPAEFVVAGPVAPDQSGFTPLRAALLVSWLLVLGSIIALASVTRASLALAERRGRFVSAVTHELRTPLTTFRLYSQMLADGMIPEEASRRDYARTLHDESLRLSRIVESVLDYARLGRDAPPKPESTTLGQLRSRIEPELLETCRRGEMTLECSSLQAEDTVLRTDTALVARIIGNLVDNACKYASNSPDPRVVLTWTVADGRLSVRVRDFGPGIPQSEHASVFAPFIRGKAHSHGQQPGLGLGLALSRSLAERLGGKLHLIGHDRGVEFVLDVPA